MFPRHLGRPKRREVRGEELAIKQRKTADPQPRHEMRKGDL